MGCKVVHGSLTAFRIIAYMKFECVMSKTVLTDHADRAVGSFDTYGEAHSVADGRIEELCAIVQELDDRICTGAYKYPVIIGWLYNL